MGSTKRSEPLSRQGNRVQPPIQASTAYRQPAEPSVSQQQGHDPYGREMADAGGIIWVPSSASVGSNGAGVSRHGLRAASPSRATKAAAVKGISSAGSMPRAASGAAGIRSVQTVLMMPPRELKFPSSGRG